MIYQFQQGGVVPFSNIFNNAREYLESRALIDRSKNLNKPTFSLPSLPAVELNVQHLKDSFKSLFEMAHAKQVDVKLEAVKALARLTSAG